jgi:hypothetical protein
LRGPQNLTPPDRLHVKFRDCAARALRADAIEPVFEALGRVEAYADIRELTALLEKAVR